MPTLQKTKARIAELVPEYNHVCKEGKELKYCMCYFPPREFSLADVLQAIHKHINNRIQMGSDDHSYAVDMSGNIYEMYGHFGTPYYKTEPIAKWSLPHDLDHQTAATQTAIGELLA